MTMSAPPDSRYRRAIDYGVFVVLIVTFAVAMIRRVRRPVDADRLLTVTRQSEGQALLGPDDPGDPSEPSLTREAVHIKINPNSASWWELAELPGIGETKARAIIAFREQAREAYLAENPGAEPPPVFKDPEDLEEVSGIGPVTVEKMRPMLALPEPTEATGDDPEN